MLGAAVKHQGNDVSIKSIATSEIFWLLGADRFFAIQSVRSSPTWARRSRLRESSTSSPDRPASQSTWPVASTALGRSSAQAFPLYSPLRRCPDVVVAIRQLPVDPMEKRCLLVDNRQLDSSSVFDGTD